MGILSVQNNITQLTPATSWYSSFILPLNEFAPFWKKYHDPAQSEKNYLNFNYTILCGASEGSIKPFEAPQYCVKKYIS